MKKGIYVVAILLLAISTPTLAQSTKGKPNKVIRVKTTEQLVEEGINYAKAENYTEAAKSFAEAADRGDATAQYNLGVYYENGLGVEKSIQSAGNMYYKAACQGHAEAQYNLGILLYNMKNYKEAANWWEKAAEKGLPDAQFNLATLYEGGFGVEKNTEKAISLYKKSAAQGNENAKSVLKELGY